MLRKARKIIPSDASVTLYDSVILHYTSIAVQFGMAVKQAGITWTDYKGTQSTYLKDVK